MKTLLILLLCGCFSCCGQEKNNFYCSQTFASLKQSILNAVDTYPKNQDLNTDNFRVLVSNYFDSTSFYTALDTLKKYDNGSYSCYYVIMRLTSGERTFSKIVVRGSSNKGGKEIFYDVLHLEERGLRTKDYTHDKQVFNNVFERMKPITDSKELLSSGDMFSVSLFKNGTFDTKLFKANRLSTEYFDKIDAFFGDE